MKNPLIPISWGELIDKITILQIKSERLSSKDALINIITELNKLSKIYDAKKSEKSNINRLEAELRLVNTKLWNIEDDIRNKERQQMFDNDFIQLARSVYITNDERSRIKRKINDLFGSELVEEKGYADY
jgi:hypothetical protein|tara:strand:+ start:6981 stop:7370 length:390 start_codon:yes stop_codon:yes gene_type:complete